MATQTASSTHTDLPSQYVTFRVGDLFFGIDVLQVQEIIRYQAMTPVPLAPGAVRGLINLRGQIITAIDLRTILQMSNLNEDSKPMNVVVKVGSEVVSLLVDSIGDVCDVALQDFEDVPDTVAPYLRSILKGVFKMKSGLLLILGGELCIKSIAH